MRSASKQNHLDSLSRGSSKARPAHKEFRVMMETVVGLIGLILILYLLATIVWPEKF